MHVGAAPVTDSEHPSVLNFLLSPNIIFFFFAEKSCITEMRTLAFSEETIVQEREK